MSVVDNLKKQAGDLKEKASELTGRHNDQIDHAVDKTGEALDKATRHKYSEKIEKMAGKAKHAVDEFAHKPAQEEPGEGPAEGESGA